MKHRPLNEDDARLVDFLGAHAAAPPAATAALEERVLAAVAAERSRSPAARPADDDARPAAHVLARAVAPSVNVRARLAAAAAAALLVVAATAGAYLHRAGALADAALAAERDAFWGDVFGVAMADEDELDTGDGPRFAWER
jgi:hypothetical protein